MGRLPVQVETIGDAIVVGPGRKSTGILPMGLVEIRHLLGNHVPLVHHDADNETLSAADQRHLDETWSGFAKSLARQGGAPRTSGRFLIDAAKSYIRLSQRWYA